MFLVKVIAHRRESANEEADVHRRHPTDNAIASKDVATEWQAKMLPQNGNTEQFKYSSHAKSLRVAKKEVQRATKIESRRRTASHGAEGISTRLSRRGRAQAPELCDKSL